MVVESFMGILPLPVLRERGRGEGSVLFGEALRTLSPTLSLSTGRGSKGSIPEVVMRGSWSPV
jgi:hypothetical protein